MIKQEEYEIAYMDKRKIYSAQKLEKFLKDSKVLFKAK